jgi:predicted transcriptional regulator
LPQCRSSFPPQRKLKSMNQEDDSKDSLESGLNEYDLTNLTAQVVTAYVAKNAVAPSDLPNLIHTVHQSLYAMTKKGGSDHNISQKPMVPIKRSVPPDYIICLEDGRKFQMLKRHLRTQYNMTPDEYRSKWNLPFDYPMVAPNYSKKRSSFAKAIGLGTSTTKTYSGT